MTLTKQVLYCLEQYPETRNSDIALTIRIWQNFTDKLIWSEKSSANYVKVKDLFEMPREDWVKRIRAKIQNEDKLFPPTNPEVIKARRQERGKWLNTLGYKN